MLVLTRFKRESIDIATSDGPITIHIGEVRGGKVKVGVEAPKQCKVKRSELPELPHPGGEPKAA